MNIDLAIIKDALALILGAGGVYVLAAIRADLRHVLQHVEDHENRIRTMEGTHKWTSKNC